ncbi:SNF2 family N-terminal domain-containing protein [Phanerochaete sordida]|uniref:SNF2 family N-terminal domain-containing protein n=1 Tax=Phanerochaete sordida TaxID=48140 RepID=A0A9P3LF65_9APHY|nr:SNF2 family N-terminal domain-containing protein [Phanerochaete sordida]
MATPPPNGARQTSRLLAALDNPGSLFDFAPTQHAGEKHALSSSPPPSTGYKRRATGSGVRASARALAAAATSALGGLGISATDEDIDDSEDEEKPSTSQRTFPNIRGEFSIHYDIESAVTQLDVGGQDQAIRLAEFVTRTLDNSMHGITVQKAMDYLKLKEKRHLLPGMEVRLLDHQIVGVSWMLRQELETAHKGGIMADEMGLGKTVQMIATMAMNMPDEDEQWRTTLVVVPAALLRQWKDEIETKTNGLFTVHIQHGKEKLKKLGELKKKDVIITTYQTLNMDFATPDDVEEDEKLEWVIENGGPLARMKWYRVITDEAQFIRNRGTRSSKACAMLRAKYRWCLTGTPVTNTLADIYGLIRFGHWRPWNDWYSFNEFIAKTQLEDAPLAGLRAQEVLKPLLLRRTKDAEIEGKPILQLPEKHVDIVRLQFSKDERQLYDHIEKKAQIQINRYLRQGTIVKNHSAVLVLILRLRQLCCHPNLVLHDDSGDPTMAMASAAEKEFERAKKVMGVRWAMDMKKQFLDRAKAALRDYDAEDLEADDGTCPVCNEMFVGDNGLVLACGHEVCSDCCRELASAPVVHDGIFGEADDDTNMRVEAEFEKAAAKGLRPCPICKKMNDLRQSATFRSSAFKPTEDELQAATRRRYPGSSRNASGNGASSQMQSRKPAADVINIDDSDDELSSSDDDIPNPAELLRNHRNIKTPSMGKGKEKAKPSQDDEVTEITMQDVQGTNKVQEPSRDVFKTWAHGGANVEPSAKMLAMIELLKEWEVTGDKTICFSQWTSMLDLVESIFIRNGIQNLRYDGSMGRDARDYVLKRFKQPGGPRVILISTKCGGVGLNLVSANRIINLDLSWNYASESQAYDRVHRLGQEKEVFVKRLVVDDTLEERMLKLQDTKTGLAEAALGEGGGVKLHKLSVKELKDLFGMSKPKDDPRNQSTLDQFGQGQD